jgi:hypothetical protein
MIRIKLPGSFPTESGRMEESKLKLQNIGIGQKFFFNDGKPG